MLEEIRTSIGYDLKVLVDDVDVLMDILIGHGLRSREVRRTIGCAAAKFLSSVMSLRANFLRAAEGLDLVSFLTPSRSSAAKG